MFQFNTFFERAQIDMSKMRILGIVPYVGLKKMMTDIAEESDNLDLEVFVGNLQEGVNWVRSLEEAKYDLIISRGGTAKLIEQHTQIPVVEIGLSEYDILSALKLVDTYDGKFAVVEYPGTIQQIKAICQLTGIEVDTYTVQCTEGTLSCLERLKAEGYSLVVGGAGVIDTAKSIYMNSILITSSKESLLAAFKFAEKLFDAIRAVKVQHLFFKDVLDHAQTGVVVYNQQGQEIYANLLIGQMPESSNIIKRVILPNIERLFAEKQVKFVRKSKGYLWLIQGVLSSQCQPEYAYFFITRSIDISGMDRALSYHDMLNFSHNHRLFYSESDVLAPILDLAKKVAATGNPVLICGEIGTGRNSIARFIHQNSTLSNCTMLRIECAMLDSKQFAYLFQNEHSPLNEAGICVFFANIHVLDENSCRLMLSYLLDTSLHRRNRIIYSCSTEAFDSEENLILSRMRTYHLECTKIILPSLRERRQDIPSLASMFINEWNAALGKQIAGLMPESLQLLQDFPWKYNINQLIQVIHELVLVCDSTFIGAEQTAQVLKKEHRYFEVGHDLKNDLLKGTLDEITFRIIQLVYEQEGMNQSKTAKRLGVGRSTLWRKFRI